MRDVALLLLEKRISAVPVLAADQQLVGMVSENDLIGRNVADRVARRDWWLALPKNGQPLAESIEALVARSVEQVMHAPVITIEARTPSHEIAEMLRVYDIERLPVMRGGRIAGIVSRSDLVRAMATMNPQPATGRAVGGLAAMIAGTMKAERPPEASASAPSSAAPFVVPRVITAAAFLTLVAASKQAEKDEVIAAKAPAKLDHGRRLKDQAAGTCRHAGVDQVARGCSSRGDAWREKL